MENKVKNIQVGMNNDSVRLMVSPSIFAMETFFYVQEIGYLEVNSTFQPMQNLLDSFLLLYVVSGRGKLIYKNNEHQLEAGNVFFIDCKKQHNYYAIDNKEWHILYLYFNGIQASGYYNMILKRDQQIKKVENRKIIESLIWQIISLHRRNNNFAEELTSLHITRLLTEIGMSGDGESNLDVEYPGFIDCIFNHIGRYYNEQVTLDMLSEIYSVNKFYLAREFKRCTGTTINQYLITTRINKAKLLLHYSSKSIEQISEEVGFNSTSHFIEMFRNREHVTPLYYRKQLIK